MSKASLGIHIGHGRGAAVVRDGRLVAQLAEERLDRVKHSSSPELPAKSIAAVLEIAGLKPFQLGVVGISYTNVTIEDVITQLAPEIRDLLNHSSVPVHGIRHHDCHAWSTYCTSDFDRALILVADGAGDIVDGRLEAQPSRHGIFNDELKLLVTSTIKGKDIEAGEAVFLDNIADIQQVTFHGISVPEDTGIVFVFSQGWRKGFYFDLVPLLGPSFTRRNYDLTKLLGQSFAYLVFQHLFKITESEWAVMLDQKWFPYITLKNHIVKEIIAYARNQSVHMTLAEDQSSRPDSLGQAKGITEQAREISANSLLKLPLSLIIRPPK